jgi:hypothetical protein
MRRFRRSTGWPRLPNKKYRSMQLSVDAVR